MKLWQRYFFRRIFSTFVFILFCLFAIYVLVDLSVNGVRFFTRGPSTRLDIWIYYCLQFSLRIDLFLPLAFLLAMLNTLFTLNAHFELVALQTSGLSRKKLLIPFVWVAALLSLVSYANHEWVAPIAVKDINAFKRSKAKKPDKKKFVQTIALEDGSELVYQSFDAQASTFSDVFWIRSPKDLWTMKTLSFTHGPMGQYVDHLTRSPQGLLEKVESFPTHYFSEMPLRRLGIPGEIIPFEGRSLSTLLEESTLPSIDLPLAQTHLHRKLALPLLPFLVIIAIAPFAVTFSRQKNGIYLVAFSLFGFIVLMILYDSLVILGENRLVPPTVAMWAPLLATLSLFSRRFWLFR